MTSSLKLNIPLALQRCHLPSGNPVKVTTISLCSEKVPWLSLVLPDWCSKSKADTSYTDQGIKNWGENGFLHVGLERRDLFKSQSCPRKAINSTLNFSISLRVEIMRQLLRLNKQKAMEVPADPARVSEKQDIHLDQPGSDNHK